MNRWTALLLGIVILMFQMISLHADCAGNGISVWPSGHQVSSNPIFIIEGYYGSQQVIRELNSKYRVCLKTDQSVVPLRVTKINESKRDLTQAVVEPLEQLKEGQKYVLHIDNLDKWQRLNFDSNDWYWYVNRKADTGKPIWRYVPQYIGTTVRQYGCGPSVYANFSLSFSDESAVALYTRLRDTRSGEESEYILTPESSVVQLGFGMCSGEFALESGHQYKADFKLMDQSGNLSDPLQDLITFEVGAAADTSAPRIPKLVEAPKERESQVAGDNYSLLFYIVPAIVVVLILMGRRFFKTSH